MPVKKSKSVGKASTAKPSRRRATVTELAPAVWDEDIRGDRGLDTPERIEARPVMLLVVGPHRSGTSVAARALECLGAVNSPNLMPANEANPKGYFEDNDIYLFNERVLLPALGRAWYSTCPVDWTVLSHAERSRLGLQALEIIRRNYPLGNAVSVLKEPRISALLPFWLSVLQHAGFAVRLVGAVRDPLSVARSLRQRDGFSLTHGGMLYLTTWVSILQQAGETALALLSFEDLLANPSQALRRAADRLQLLLPADFEARAAGFAAGHIDRDLCHSIVDPNDVSLEPDLPPAVTDLFAGLREAVSSQNPRKAAKAVAAAERLVQAMLPALADFDRVFWERLNERQKARGASEQLQQQVQTYQARVHELEQSSSALQHQLQSASGLQELANLRAQAEALQVTAAEKSARLEALTAELAARETRLQEVQAQLDTLRSENSELVTRHQLLATAHEDLATRHQSLVTASQQREAEYSELGTRYQQLEATHSALAARHHVVFTSEQSLTGRLAALEAQNQEVTARQVAADDERQRLAAERDNLAAQLESLRLEHSDLATRHTSFVTSQEELVTRHQSLVTNHEDLVTRHTSLITAHESLDTAHAKLIARHAALEAERSELVARRQLLATNLQSLESKQSSGAQEISALRNRLDRAEEQCKEAIARAGEAERKEEELEAKIALLAAAREKLVAEKDDLTSRLARSESERGRLQQVIDERFGELAKLRKRLADVEDEKMRGEQDQQILVSQINKQGEEYSLLLQRHEAMLMSQKDLESKNHLLETDSSSAIRECNSLRHELRNRYEELARITQRLLQTEEQLFSAHNELQTVMASSSWRLTSPLRKIKRSGAVENQNSGRNMHDDYHIIKESGLFDTNYYLRRYPDVAQRNIDPIRHYIMHGAAEGRDPSSKFSTRNYVCSNPELLSSKVAPNPLVHYVLFKTAQNAR